MLAVSLALAFSLVASTEAAEASVSQGVPPALEACLRKSIGTVVVQGEPSYDEAKRCRNTRVDIVPSPLAVVRVSSEVEVQAAVGCAAAQGVQACARAGAHGFENAAGCSGGLAIDLEDMQDLAVDPTSQVIRFGAGNTLGQLYYKLKTDHDLVVPGGAESGVGAAGLFLGCGRGMLTQLHGLACDTIRGIRYVDAQGELQEADADTNPDMLWMAKGGGGEFPGIVTEFKVQAFPAPRLLHARDCTFPYHRAKALIKTWASHLEEMSDPVHQMFTHITMWNSRFVNLPNLCFDCSPEQVRWFEAKVDEIAEAVGGGQCHSFAHSWFDQLLFEAGRDHGVIKNSPEALLDRNQGYGAKGPARASKNGGYLADSYDVSDEMLDTLTNWTFGNMKKPYPWSLLVLIYNLGGPKITDVPATSAAYSGRGAKFVVHFKHQWDEESLTSHADLMQHHHDMSVALERHLPCKGFYNYMNGDMPCAKGNRDKWLSAFFSDVERMQQIKATADPQGVFQSHLLPNGVAPSSRRRRHQFISFGSESQSNTESAPASESIPPNLTSMLRDVSTIAIGAPAVSESTPLPTPSTSVASTLAGQPSTSSVAEVMDIPVEQKGEGETLPRAPSDDEQEDDSDIGLLQGVAAFVVIIAVPLGFLGMLSLVRMCRRRSKLPSGGKHVASIQETDAKQSTTAHGASTESATGLPGDGEPVPKALAVAAPAEKEDKEGDEEDFTRNCSRQSTGVGSAVLAFWPSSSSMSSAGAESCDDADMGADTAVPEVHITVA